MSDTLQISEIFQSLQGEGARAGWPCVLIRLAGCDLRCTWCDTQYAWDDGEPMTLDAICTIVAEYSCGLVEVTGGEPLAQPAAGALLTLLCDAGYEVLLETSGARDIAAVDDRVVRIVDIKCPASGAADKMHWPNLDEVRRGDEVKFVLADRTDYDYARDVIDRYDLCNRCAVLMGPVADQLGPAQLAAWILADRLNVRLNLQLHKAIWPTRERGV